MVKKIFISVNRVYPYTDSDPSPPENPCPIRFRWRSVTHVHVSGHVGVSEQRLGSRPGGDDISCPFLQSSPHPAAVGAPPYRPVHGL